MVERIIAGLIGGILGGGLGYWAGYNVGYQQGYNIGYSKGYEVCEVKLMLRIEKLEEENLKLRKKVSMLENQLMSMFTILTEVREMNTVTLQTLQQHSQILLLLSKLFCEKGDEESEKLLEQVVKQQRELSEKVKATIEKLETHPKQKNHSKYYLSQVGKS